MGNDDHRNSIDALRGLVTDSSVSDEQWDAAPSPLTGWQRGVLTRMHALTIHDEIHYLSSAKLDTGDWDFVAFTENRVVRVLVSNAGSDAVRYETVTFPRDSLESLELLDIEKLPEGDESWPVDVNLIGHYGVGSVPLPLDSFASPQNKRDLSVLLRSLLQDLAH
ncbi:MAG: hypothetical protein ABJA94_08100 [Rhodoglobus sp.]